MAKYSKSAPKQYGKSGNEGSEKYRDYNPMPLDPLKAQEQFKPTDAEPVPLHKKMAGC